MWFISWLLFGTLLLQAAAPDLRAMLDQVEARLRQDAANPRLLAARGILLGKTGREREGLESLEKALAVSPKFLLALEGAAEISFRLHDANAAAYLARILAFDPANAEAHAMSGTLAFEARDCASAAAYFAKAEAVVNRDALALAQWGECLAATGRPAAGAERLNQSLALRPEAGPEVAYDLVLALHLAGRGGEALAASSRFPQTAEMENLRGLIFASLDRIPEALAALRHATELAPKDERNYVDLATLCLDHQSFDVAEAVVNAGLANVPESAALYTLRGAILAQTSKVDESAADFERARRLGPDRDYGDLGLTLLLRQQNQIEQAIGVVRARLAKAPHDATLEYLLADLLLRQEEDAGGQAQREALGLLQNVVRARPEMAKAHSALGKLLLQNGDAAAAVAELQRALELDGTDRVALNQYVLALRRLNRTAEAAQAARHLRDLLAAERGSEVQKNRVRLVQIPNSNR